jgi:hypothetical protein
VRYLEKASGERVAREHNHPADDVISLALYRRQFRQKYLKTIMDLTAAAILTDKIIVVINQQCDSEEAIIIAKDITNIKTKVD